MNILIAIPCYGGNVSNLTFHSILNTLAGSYSGMNSSEYVWLVTKDVNVGKKDLKKDLKENL